MSKKSRYFFLMMLGMVLAFNANANANANANEEVLQAAQNLLVEINKDQGFWLYSFGKPKTLEEEQAFFQEYQKQQDKDFCDKTQESKVLFDKVNEKTKFSEHHVVLLFSDVEHKEREKQIRSLVEKYQLPCLVVYKKEDEFSLTLPGQERPVSLQNTFNRLNANCHDVFLIKPKSQQISVLSRSHHPCLLEQDLFFSFYSALKNYKEDK